MIGNSGISSYGTHSHGHNVTKCLHQTYDTKLKSGGSMPGGAGLQAGTGAKAQERFSVTDLLSGGWGNFLTRSASLFGRIWGNGQAGHGYGDSGKSGVWPAAGQDTAGIAADTAAGASAARQADAMGRLLLPDR